MIYLGAPVAIVLFFNKKKKIEELKSSQDFSEENIFF